MDEPFTVVASNEDDYSRYELREYPNRWEAVQLRHAVGGGWYVRNNITIFKEMS